MSTTNQIPFLSVKQTNAKENGKFTLYRYDVRSSKVHTTCIYSNQTYILFSIIITITGTMTIAMAAVAAPTTATVPIKCTNEARGTVEKESVNKRKNK